LGMNRDCVWKLRQIIVGRNIAGCVGISSNVERVATARGEGSELVVIGIYLCCLIAFGLRLQLVV